MLLPKFTTPNSIVSVKLINGDELIARYDSEDDATITINRPLALTMQGGGLGMIPWMLLGDKDTYVLQKAHVFAMVPSKQEAADQYTEGTTGIALA